MGIGTTAKAGRGGKGRRDLEGVGRDSICFQSIPRVLPKTSLAVIERQLLIKFYLGDSWKT